MARTGSYLEDLPALWQAVTLEESPAIVLTTLEAVYVDMDGRQLVAVRPKADFLPLLAAASPTWGLAGKSLLHGDPEGIRTPDLQRDKLVC